MRVEVGTSRPAPGPVAAGRAAARRRLDGFELMVLLAFAGVSVWVLGLDLWQVVVHNRVWTGTDGFYVVDQMQYLAWIRSASHHLLASNLFVLRHTPADYFQPAVAVSGALSALGVAPWLSLLLWKPVAVLACFFAIRAYARRSLTGAWPQRAVLVLALFFGSFTIVYGQFGVIGDMFPGFLSWGYTFGLLAVAAVPAALLSYGRARGSDRVALVPGLLGALASSLHPWQGELLILILLGVEVLAGRWRLEPLRRRWTQPGLTLALTVIPLAYYAALGREDVSWTLAREASKHSFALWTIALALAPLAIPAAFAWRRRPRTYLDAVTRIWPPAAFAIYVVSATGLSATPLHAFDGITIPLAVLAVEAACALRWRWRLPRQVAWAGAVLLATVPATAYELNSARSIVAPSQGNPNFVTRDEDEALDYLAHNRAPGGVLTRFYLGTVIPERTGRRTFVGHCMWSQPKCGERARIAQYLIEGSLRPKQAQRFVRRTGARFVLSDCASPADLTSTLAPMIRSVERFGCARVYEVDPTPPPAWPVRPKL